jgi:ADP-L-glycero-D-manno-heptose 6-epimerase
MIIVTGAAGFIGSNLVRALNARGERDILAVDNLSRADKFKNLADCEIADYLDKDELPLRLASLPPVRALLHQGACSDTMATDGRYVMANNYRTRSRCWSGRSSGACRCSTRPARRSTAARRASSRAGLRAAAERVRLLEAAVRPGRAQPAAAGGEPRGGLRYFNVYGPRESHKGRMASVAFHNHHEFLAHGRVELFEGRDGWPDGGQQRDFIHVDDVVAVNLWLLEHPGVSGIYNCGTGRAQAFNEVAQTVVGTMRALRGEPGLAPERMAEAGLVRYKPFPEALVGKYQSFTQADATRLREAGYDAPF